MKRIVLSRHTALSISGIILIITLAICNNNRLNATQTATLMQGVKLQSSVAKQPRLNVVSNLARNNLLTYLDDRSNPIQLLKSYYNAINLKEYVRAYSYWSQNGNSATSQPPPYPQFEAGYAKTEAVQLTTGKVTGNGAAGTIYYQVPVTLVATHTDNSKHTYVGCYTLRQPNPAIFGKPPFIPMSIYSAKIQEVPSKANTGVLMQQSCK